MFYKSKKAHISIMSLVLIFIFSLCFNTVKAYGELPQSNSGNKSELEENIRLMVVLEDDPIIKNSKLTKNEIVENQKKIIKEVEKINGVEIKNSYSYLTNGFSLDIKRKYINKVQKIQGIKCVYEAKTFKPSMAYAKEIMNTYNVWKDMGYKGEGMVIAILDSGIDINHKDMKINDPSKVRLTEEKINKIIAEGNLKGEGNYFSKKVPFGYNYADNNLNILDTSKSTGMHGMHVAGIAGANASKEEVDVFNGVQGIAPEAQLLAMRIFSNDSKKAGVTEDTLVKAINDAVILGADVINLSLGVEAGFSNEGEFLSHEHEAVKNAMEAGVFVVSAAGNEAYSTYPLKRPDMPDTGNVDAPGVFKEAISVAAIDNTHIRRPHLQYKIGDDEGAMPYSYASIYPVTGRIFIDEYWDKDENGNDIKVKEEKLKGKLDGEYELVDAGYGSKEELKELGREKLTGKIALIKRGKTEYETMKRWASIKHAVGIIIYNTDGNEEIVNMFDDGDDLPAVFVKNSDGVKLLNSIDKGVKVTFKEDKRVIENFSAGDMYTFTSWGPTPSLEFKPDITAPGMNIYSTINNNNYKFMHGTSMAAPQISGAIALLKEAVNNNEKLKVENKELSQYVKATLMNTAVPQMDKDYPDVPFSPRRQGGGVAQIDKAIKNKVTVVYKKDQYPGVALKEIGKTTEFTLELKNYGEKDIEYSIKDFGGVYSETLETITTENSAGAKAMPYEVKINGARITFDKNTVVVPANGTNMVRAKITLPDTFKTEQFVEGFVEFKSNDSEENPSLTIPYMGFYGEWYKQQIMDKPIWDKENVKNKTALIDAVVGALGYGMEYELGFSIDEDGEDYINPNATAISPNGDYNMDFALPRVWFLRHASEVTGEVLDKDKNVVRHLGTKRLVRASTKKPEKLVPLMWDGVIGSDGKIAPEGQYYIRLRAKAVDGNAEYEEMILPVKVDISRPKVEILSKDKVTTEGVYYLKWKMTDEVSGLFRSRSKWSGETLEFIINGNFESDYGITELGDDTYSAELYLQDGDNEISFYVTDNSGLTTISQFNIKKLPIEAKFNEVKAIEDNLDIDLTLRNTSGWMKREGKLIITIYDIDNRMLQYKELAGDLAEGEEKNIKTTFENAENSYKVKILYVDSLETMNPIIDPVEYKINQSYENK